MDRSRPADETGPDPDTRCKVSVSAYHEAGHAVAIEAMGYRIISFDAGAANGLGSVYEPLLEDALARKALHEHAVLAVAGKAAEVILSVDDPDVFEAEMSFLFDQLDEDGDVEKLLVVQDMAWTDAARLFRCIYELGRAAGLAEARAVMEKAIQILRERWLEVARVARHGPGDV
jgi:hypothetical protein